MGIRDRPISPRSPWQNPYVERLIGTLRRDCLDHVLIFSEGHLRRVLTSYSAYYNETRTHLGLSKDAPRGEPSSGPGQLLPYQFSADYIIVTRGYNFREGQVLNMAPTDEKSEVVAPAEVPEDLPLPSDPKVIFLGGLFVLAVLVAAYVASDIVLPLVFAIVLKLLLQPALRILERLARTADNRVAAADPCAFRNDRRLGYGHFRPRSHLGMQASRGHSSASGTVELH